MKAIKPEDLNSLYEWIELITIHKDVIVESLDCQLTIFDKGDASYLVINSYQSPCEAIEYFIKPENNTNSLMGLITVLHSFDFSLKSLLTELSNREFVEEASGEYAMINNVKVYRETVTPNEVR